METIFADESKGGGYKSNSQHEESTLQINQTEASLGFMLTAQLLMSTALFLRCFGGPVHSLPVLGQASLKHLQNPVFLNRQQTKNRQLVNHSLVREP